MCVSVCADVCVCVCVCEWLCWLIDFHSFDVDYVQRFATEKAFEEAEQASKEEESDSR